MSNYINQRSMNSIDSVQFFMPIGDKIKESGFDVGDHDLGKLYLYATFGFNKEARDAMFFKSSEYMLEQGVIDPRDRAQMIQEYSLHRESPTFEKYKQKTDGLEVLEMKFLMDQIHKTKDSEPLDTGIVTEDWLKQNYELLRRDNMDMANLKLYAELMLGLVNDKNLSGVMSASPTQGGNFTVMYEQGDTQKCLWVESFEEDTKVALYDTTEDKIVKTGEIRQADMSVNNIFDMMNLKTKTMPVEIEQNQSYDNYPSM